MTVNYCGNDVELDLSATNKIALTNDNAVVTQDCVGHRHMKVKIGQREMQQISLTLERRRRTANR